MLHSIEKIISTTNGYSLVGIKREKTELVHKGVFFLLHCYRKFIYLALKPGFWKVKVDTKH